MFPNYDPSPISLLKARSLFDSPRIVNSKGYEINIGDHLSSPRGNGIYSHHGIYIGDGKVIHYSGFADGMASGKVEIASIISFSGGNEIFIHYHKKCLYSPEEVVERARSRLGEDWYNVVINNCEHFVYWCIMGKHSSAQINNCIDIISQGLELFLKNKNSVQLPQSSPIPTRNIPDILVKSKPSVMTGQQHSSSDSDSFLKVAFDIFKKF